MSYLLLVYPFSVYVPALKSQGGDGIEEGANNEQSEQVDGQKITWKSDAVNLCIFKMCTTI